MMHQLYGCDDPLQMVKTDKAPICGPYLHPAPGKEGKQHLHTHRSGWPITIQEMFHFHPTGLWRSCFFFFAMLFLLLPACFCVCVCCATLIVACVNAAPAIIINSGLSLSWAAEFSAVVVDNVECNGMPFLYRSFIQLSIFFGHHS